MLNVDVQWIRDKFHLKVALSLAAGEVVLLSGPSGSGKTSLLRMIAGLEHPTQGVISWRDETWVDTRTRQRQPAQKRNCGLVFQAYALFPHWTVADNLAYAQKEKSDPVLWEELIEACDLRSLLGRFPHQLSGGQQQRVALARSLLRQNEILLLDEPFAAQDWAGRQRLIGYFQQYQQRYQTLMIISSHDSRGLQTWATRKLYMTNGRLVLSGPSANEKVVFIFLSLEVLHHRTFARLQRNGREVWWPDPPEEWGALHEGATLYL